MIRLSLGLGKPFALVNPAHVIRVVGTTGPLSLRGIHSLVTMVDGETMEVTEAVATIEKMIDDLRGPRSISINPSPEEVAKLMAMPRGGSPILPPEPSLDVEKVRYALRLALYMRNRRHNDIAPYTNDELRNNFQTAMQMEIQRTSSDFQAALSEADDIATHLMEAYRE